MGAGKRFFSFFTITIIVAIALTGSIVFADPSSSNQGQNSSQTTPKKTKEECGKLYVAHYTGEAMSGNANALQDGYDKLVAKWPECKETVQAHIVARKYSGYLVEGTILKTVKTGIIKNKKGETNLKPCIDVCKETNTCCAVSMLEGAKYEKLTRECVLYSKVELFEKVDKSKDANAESYSTQVLEACASKSAPKFVNASPTFHSDKHSENDQKKDVSVTKTKPPTPPAKNSTKAAK